VTFTAESYTLGKGTPIVPLKLGSKDPPGFISHLQALRASMANPISAAEGLFPIIGKALGRQERLQEVLITAFCESPSYSDSKTRFDRMASHVKKLDEAQLLQIIDSYAKNSQLYGAGHLTSRYERLRHFLEQATGKQFTIERREIKEVKPALRFDDDDEKVPF